uniref:C2H2-type domain-containing protein n=1 Tax=Globodera pallida TaxID=36090 RepID=A0A183C625_GLOPA
MSFEADAAVVSEEANSESDVAVVKCTECDRTFKAIKNMKIHRTKMHFKKAAVVEATQPQFGAFAREESSVNTEMVSSSRAIARRAKPPSAPPLSAPPLPLMTTPRGRRHEEFRHAAQRFMAATVALADASVALDDAFKNLHI